MLDNGIAEDGVATGALCLDIIDFIFILHVGLLEMMS